MDAGGISKHCKSQRYRAGHYIDQCVIDIFFIKEHPYRKAKSNTHKEENVEVLDKKSYIGNGHYREHELYNKVFYPVLISVIFLHDSHMGVSAEKNCCCEPGIHSDEHIA